MSSAVPVPLFKPLWMQNLPLRSNAVLSIQLAPEMPKVLGVILTFND